MLPIVYAIANTVVCIKQVKLKGRYNYNISPVSAWGAYRPFSNQIAEVTKPKPMPEKVRW